MCSRNRVIPSHKMRLLTSNSKTKHTSRIVVVDPDSPNQASALIKKSIFRMNNISRFRILFSFYIIALVRAKHFGRDPIFGITSHLLMQSGRAQVTTTRERIDALKPMYAIPPTSTSTEDRAERSKVILSANEKSGEDGDICFPNHQQGGEDQNENECIRTDLELEQESSTLDYDIQFEASYKMRETAATATISRENMPAKKSVTLMSKIISTYLHFLGSHALLTKSLTSGLIGGLGDICAQCFEQRGISGVSLFNMAVPLDRRRLFGIFFESTFLSGPLMHFAYDYMEYLVPVHDFTSEDEVPMNGDIQEQVKGGKKSASSLQQWFAATFHVMLDIIVLGPIFVLSLMATTSVIEGKVGSLKQELMTEFAPTLWASTLASIGFIPTQLLAFRLLPVQFRLLYMNVQDIVWNAIVSFMAHKAR